MVRLTHSYKNSKELENMMGHIYEEVTIQVALMWNEGIRTNLITDKSRFWEISMVRILDVEKVDNGHLLSVSLSTNFNASQLASFRFPSGYSRHCNTVIYLNDSGLPEKKGQLLHEMLIRMNHYGYCPTQI